MLLHKSPLSAIMDHQILSLAQLSLSSLKLTPEADISRIQSGAIKVIILSPESFECVVVKRTMQRSKAKSNVLARYSQYNKKVTM